jgi:hypothetical protein
MIRGNVKILTHRFEQRGNAIEDGAVCLRIQEVMQSGSIVASRPKGIKLHRTRIVLPAMTHTSEEGVDWQPFALLKNNPTECMNFLWARNKFQRLDAHPAQKGVALVQQEFSCMR